jgi:hypothetical protein
MFLKKSRELVNLRIIEESLPIAFQNRPFLYRFIEENKHFHKWMSIIYYYSPVFPRLFRVLSLFMNIISLLFIQSITYDFSYPNDGFCEAQQTENKCLLQHSSFSSGNKCNWQQSSKQCYFNEPIKNFQLVFLIAILSAIFSTPIAASTDWIILNILAADNKTVAKKTTTISNKRRSNISNVEEDSNRKLKSSVQDELALMMEKMLSFRESLSTERQREFDGDFVLLNFTANQF